MIFAGLFPADPLHFAKLCAIVIDSLLGKGTAIRFFGKRVILVAAEGGVRTGLPALISRDKGGGLSLFGCYSGFNESQVTLGFGLKTQGILAGIVALEVGKQ